MLGKTWRVVLLVVILVAAVWPNLLGSSTSWIGLIAIVLLLISELTCKNTCEAPMKNSSIRRSRPVARKATRKRRRR
jgi:hypothetical protein